MLLIALVMAAAAAWLADRILAGDAAALVVAGAMVALGGFSCGFVAHGLLTDRIIDNCRRQVERVALEAARHYARTTPKE